MLSIIKSSILEAIDTGSEIDDEPTDKASARWAMIRRYLRTHDLIMNADVQDLCGVSSATTNRILNGLTEEGKLQKFRQGRSWAYRAM